MRPVYDLLNAGPRSQFTIITDAGPLVVSNSILGLGYGMGAPRFRHTLFIGNGGMSLDITEQEAGRIVRLYRNTYSEISKLWETLGNLVLYMMHLGKPWDGSGLRPTGEPIGIPSCIDVTANAIILPNGMPISYPDLKIEDRNTAIGTRAKELTYRGPYGERNRLFGGKVLENVDQALSRIVVTDTVRRVKAETSGYPMMTTHDSLDYLVRRSDAQVWDDYLERQFAIRPSWAQELPLASEGGWGRTLMQAEKMLDILGMRRGGMTAEKIAAALKVSLVTVTDVLTDHGA